MEEVLDSLRRIIARWAMTTTPLTADALAGSTTLTVRSTSRFKIGDEILLRRPAISGEAQDKYEWHNNPTLQVEYVTSATTLLLNQPLQSDWAVADSPLVVKATNGQFLKGVYIGDPEEISMYPAVTVNGVSTESEWLTIDSVKDTHNIEIGIFVLDSTQEAGYRFLLELTQQIKVGLQNNIFPLVNDYQTTALTADTVPGTWVINVADASVFCPGEIILLEDCFKTQEHRVFAVDTSVNTVMILEDSGIWNFQVANGAIAIQPKRFIFNSYPKSVQFGKINKGTLLKAAVIQWFGWEETLKVPTGGGGWSSPQLV